MKAIYSCKLYKAHKNKAKIQAALGDPANKGLVQQLRRYLDDEYIKPEYVDPDLLEEEVEEPVPDEENAGTEDNTPTSLPRRSTPLSSPSAPAGGPSKLDDLADRLSEEESGGNNQSIDDTDEEPAPPVEESVKVKKSAIKGSYVLPLSSSFIADACSELKGTLNMRQDTCGVDRVQFKDDEVWIYYNDKINLNNVMSVVIEVLNAANYTYLEFNRLARSDNAMVFQIIFNDSNKEVNPASFEEDTAE